MSDAISEVIPLVETKVTKPVVKKTCSKENYGFPLKDCWKFSKEWIKKFSKIIEIASTRDMNESDTSNIINDMLGDLFGYDKFFDVTTEYKIKWQYADYGVKIDDKLAFSHWSKSYKSCTQWQSYFSGSELCFDRGCRVGNSHESQGMEYISSFIRISYRPRISTLIQFSWRGKECKIYW